MVGHMAALFDSALFIDALHFASARHRGQRRHDAHASPFVNHPIETAWLLASVGGVRDAVVLAGAVLHDVLEDTPTTADEIERRFGPAVRKLVEEVTDPPATSTEERRQRQVARLNGASPEARQIRLADKIANVRALPVHWSWLQCQDYLAFAEEVAGITRGANPRLDERFRQTIDRTRATHRENRRAASLTPAPLPDLAPAPGDVPKLRVVRGLISRAEELMDAIVMNSGGRRRPSASKLSGSGPAGGFPRKGRGRRFADPALHRLAEPGMGSIVLQPGDAHHSLVSVDGARPFRISKGQAVLLAALIDVEGDDDDGFASFQSLGALAIAIAKQSGRRPDVHALTVAIGRLREVFHARGHVNPLFIETCRSKGVRLRLRRRSL